MITLLWPYMLLLLPLPWVLLSLLPIGLIQAYASIDQGLWYARSAELLEELGYMPTEKYAYADEIFEHSRRIGQHYDIDPADPASEITATSEVPPPMSTIMLPDGSVIGRPAPMAAAVACSIR